MGTDNNSWLVTFDGSHFGLVEAGQPFDMLDEESVAGIQEMVNAGDKIRVETPIGSFSMGTAEEQRLLGPSFEVFTRMLTEIKDAWDPKGIFENKISMITQ